MRLKPDDYKKITSAIYFLNKTIRKSYLYPKSNCQKSNYLNKSVKQIFEMRKKVVERNIKSIDVLAKSSE